MTVSFTRKIKAGLVKVDYTEYIGEQGTLFYNEYNGTLRISDGITPGGQPVNLLGSAQDAAIGDINISGTVISPNLPNSNITLTASGTGTVNVSSPLAVHAGSTSNPSVFEISSSGQSTAYINTNIASSGLSLIGDASRSSVPPQVFGTLLQCVGSDGKVAAILNDSLNSYSAFVGRRYNGSVASPLAVQADQVVVRFGMTPRHASGWPTVSTARIDLVTNEPQTSTSQGSRIEFWTTPNSSAIPSKRVTIDGIGITTEKLTATKEFTVATSNIPANNSSVVNIIGNDTQSTVAPANPGSMIQITGHDGSTSRIINDAFSDTASNFSAYVGRRARGTAANPQAVKANDSLIRVVGGGYAAGSGFSVNPGAGMEVVAAEDFTSGTRMGTKLYLRVTPPGSNTWIDSLLIDSTGVTIADGTRFSGKLILPASTAGLPPLQFTAGPLLTSTAVGSVNYDGKLFYATPQDSERGVIPVEQLYVSNAVRNLTAGTTAAQSIFGVAVSLSANTRYRYIIRFQVAKNGSGSNLPTVNYGLLVNTGSLFSHNYQASSSVSAISSSVSSTSSMSNYITTGFSTGVPISVAMPAATGYANIEIRGIIDVNTACTVNPQIAFSDAPNTSCSIQPQAAMLISPIGTSSAVTSIGNWV